VTGSTWIASGAKKSNLPGSGQKTSADMSDSGDKETSGKLAAFGRYLSGVFVVFTESGDYWAARKIQSVSKWIFDVLKNAMVANTLKFLADKSGFLILRIASDVAFLALLAYVTAYNNTFMFRFDPLKIRGLHSLLCRNLNCNCSSGVPSDLQSNTSRHRCDCKQSRTIVIDAVWQTMLGSNEQILGVEDKS
jgi:hypothetical protein